MYECAITRSFANGVGLRIRHFLQTEIFRVCGRRLQGKDALLACRST